MTETTAETPDDLPAADEIRYSEALSELEQILDRIENDEVDLDDLGQQVDRAAQLIQVCRGKIEKAEVQVRRIIDSLDEEEGDR